MGEEIRKTGIDVVGDVSWGTHFCQFYQTKEDLIDILVPYFKTGLENNEFCMWVTSEPLSEKEAKEAIRRAVPDFDRYLRRRQIEIIPHTEWYLKDGAFNLQTVLNGWIDKLSQALTKGYDGIRVTGNTAWLEKRDWRNFTQYEEEVNNVIGKYQMLAICTYSLDKCGASEIVDVVSNHQFALIRKRGKWKLIESSERKQAEKALQEAEERYHAIFEQAADSIVLVDAETGALVEFNDRAYQNLGYSRKEFQKLKIPDFEVTESAEEIAKRIEKIIKQGSDVFETKHRTKGGEIRDIQISARAICIGGRDFIQGIWRDITARKQAEEALREAEERYSALLNLGGEVGEAIVMLQDTEQGDAIQTFVSNEWPHITGYSRKELLGMSFFDLLHPKHREASLKRHKRKMSGEIIPGLFEMSIITKDSTEVPIELTSAYTTYKGQRANVAFIRDITERKQAEEREKELQQQLYLSSRLAAIGELAAGVAHEISNPLTGILGFSQRLMRKSTDEEVSRDLERIHSEAQRVAKVVGNLLTFARRREPRKEYSDINDILQQALELRAYELKTSDIEVVTSLAPSPLKTMADFHQIQEVFLNIILNAEQAMSEANSGGKLSVKTQPTRDYIRISFADDGPGITAEQLDKIFDPFFTTRGEKGGTGLGLSLCHGIVAEHAGRIYAKSKPGKGATFFVELPLSPVGASFADTY